MTRSKKKARTAYYKQAILKGSQTLGNLLHQVLLNEDSQFAMTESRHFCPSQSSDDYYVLNEIAQYEKMFYGELVFIERNKYQTIMHIEPNVTRYKQKLVTVEDISLDKDEVENYQKEFVENTLYFGVFENHLVVIQTTSLRINRLAEYLNYILGSQGADVLDDGIILFKDRPSAEARKKLENKPAKQVTVSQQLLTRPSYKGDSVQTYRSADFRFGCEDSDLRNIVLDYFKKNKKVSQMSETCEYDNLYVDVVLRRKGRSNEAGQKLIDVIASSFVHLNDEDFEIVYDDGKLTGKDFRLHKKINIETFDDKGNEGINHIQLQKDFYAFLTDNITDS